MPKGAQAFCNAWGEKGGGRAPMLPHLPGMADASCRGTGTGRCRSYFWPCASAFLTMITSDLTTIKRRTVSGLPWPWGGGRVRLFGAKNTLERKTKTRSCASPAPPVLCKTHLSPVNHPLPQPGGLPDIVSFGRVHDDGGIPRSSDARNIRALPRHIIQGRCAAPETDQHGADSRRDRQDMLPGLSRRIRRCAARFA